MPFDEPGDLATRIREHRRSLRPLIPGCQGEMHSTSALTSRCSCRRSDCSGTARSCRCSSARSPVIRWPSGSWRQRSSWAGCRRSLSPVTSSAVTQAAPAHLLYGAGAYPVAGLDRMCFRGHHYPQWRPSGACARPARRLPICAVSPVRGVGLPVPPWMDVIARVVRGSVPQVASWATGR